MQIINKEKVHANHQQGVSVDGELGKSLLWKIVGIVIGLGILGLVGFFVFTGLIARFGVIAALVIIFGILMLVAYRSTRRSSSPTRRKHAKAVRSRSGHAHQP